MVRKACKNCKRIYEGSSCPTCGSDSDNTVENFKGRIIVLNAEDSLVAKKMKISKKGEYAIKIR